MIYIVRVYDGQEVYEYSLKTCNDYSEAISSLLEGFVVNTIFYGIGLPTIKHKKGSIDASHLVDFIVCVNEDRSIEVAYNPVGISF